MAHFRLLRLGALALLCSLFLLVCGCDPVKLYTFVDQLKTPDKFMEFTGGKELTITFRSPLITIKDLAEIGFRPSSVVAQGDSQLLTFEFYSSKRAKNDQLQFTIQVKAKDDNVVSLTFPEVFMKLLPANALPGYLQCLGYSKADLLNKRSIRPDSRSYHIPQISMPDLPTLSNTFPQTKTVREGVITTAVVPVYLKTAKGNRFSFIYAAQYHSITKSFRTGVFFIGPYKLAFDESGAEIVYSDRPINK